jgi:hypothetical protein
MKVVFILVFVGVAFISIANAQNYGKFKLGLGAGYAGGNDASEFSGGGGALLTIEPAYRLSDKLAIGLRLEGAFYGGGHAGIPGGFVSATINGQYYFDAEPFRPFVGAGLGIFANSEIEFGFYPRFGLDWGHFTLALEFNLIPGGSSNYDSLSNTSSVTSAYYFGLRIGGFFFGGKN